MRKVGLAALCVASSLVCGQTLAAEMTADVVGSFFTGSGPTGSIPTVGYVQLFPSGALTGFNFLTGGIGWDANFTFDTSLGTLTQNNQFEMLSWSSGQGASPLRNGSFTYFVNGGPLVVDLSNATQFSVRLNATDVTFSFGGAGYSLDTEYPYAPTPPAIYDLTVPVTLPFACCDHAFGTSFTDGPYTGGGFDIVSSTLAAASVPEPGSWSLMLLGLGGLGAILRSRRRLLLAAC